jgi:hypothetical protein
MSALSSCSWKAEHRSAALCIHSQEAKARPSTVGKGGHVSAIQQGRSVARDSGARVEEQVPAHTGGHGLPTLPRAPALSPTQPEARPSALAPPSKDVPFRFAFYYYFLNLL